MKQAEILPEAMAGHPVCVAEFRDWSARETNNGSAIATTFLVVGRQTVEHQTWLKKGSKVTDAVRPPYKPGDRVAVVIELEGGKYGVRIKGGLSKFEG